MRQDEAGAKKRFIFRRMEPANPFIRAMGGGLIQLGPTAS
jgi:hypothetical protein